MYFGCDQEKPLQQQWVCPAPTELCTATQLMHLLLLKATAECLNAFLGAQGWFTETLTLPTTFPQSVTHNGTGGALSSSALLEHSSAPQPLSGVS